MTPLEPKSIEATALSATPSTVTTVPMPNESCTTRSPGSSEGTGRVPAVGFGGGADAAGGASSSGTRGRSRPRSAYRLDADVDCPTMVCAASVRLQSINVVGSSSRKRDAGLCCGAPQAERTTARET